MNFNYGKQINCIIITHVHSGDSVQKNMYGVIIALVPALLVSFYMFGLGAVIVTLTSVIACLFFEWAITKVYLEA